MVGRGRREMVELGMVEGEVGEEADFLRDEGICMIITSQDLFDGGKWLIPSSDFPLSPFFTFAIPFSPPPNPPNLGLSPRSSTLLSSQVGQIISPSGFN